MALTRIHEMIREAGSNLWSVSLGGAHGREIAVAIPPPTKFPGNLGVPLQTKVLLEQDKASPHTGLI